MEPIGKGGMGEVYRSILNGPAGFKKEVAVKLLHESVSSEKARQDWLLKPDWAACSNTLTS